MSQQLPQGHQRYDSSNSEDEGNIELIKVADKFLKGIKNNKFDRFIKLKKNRYVKDQTLR